MQQSDVCVIVMVYAVAGAAPLRALQPSGEGRKSGGSDGMQRTEEVSSEHTGTTDPESHAYGSQPAEVSEHAESLDATQWTTWLQGLDGLFSDGRVQGCRMLNVRRALVGYIG